MNRPVRRALIGVGFGLGILAGLMSWAQAAPHATEPGKAEIRRMLISEAERTIVPPSLALAVARAESNFDPGAVSHKGAIGVMQIMPRTAWSIYQVRREALFDPRLNIRIGIDFLQRLYRRYGRWDLALSHYNGGSRVGTPPNARVIPATRAYVDRVMAYRADFDRTLTVAALETAGDIVERDRGLSRRQAEAAYAMVEGPRIERNWRDYLKAAEYWLQPASARRVADLAMDADQVNGDPFDTRYGAAPKAPSAALRQRIDDLKRRFRASLDTDAGRWQPVSGDPPPYWDTRP